MLVSNKSERLISDVTGWAISEDDLHSKNSDGSYKLLTLDIDFGTQCSLCCPHCFRQDSNFNSHEDELTFEEIKNILQEAIELGLKHIKIVGAGEPFENCMIVPLIKFLNKNGVYTAIFTKGHVLGSDNKVNHFFASYGFNTSHQLMQFLKENNVSILLGFNSFNPKVQADFIGYKSPILIEEYISSRDRTLRLAIEYGFNEKRPDNKTRLALIAAPIKPENIDEILDIYKFGNKQNIYVLSCPTAQSGKGKSEFTREINLINYDQYIEKLRQLYISIYSWGIDEGYIPIDEVERHGISLYPGCHPCNQVATGMYLTLNGKIACCPGRDDKSYIIADNVRKKSLKEIWINSVNYDLASQEDKFNYYCFARDYHFFKDPKTFYGSIEKHLISKFKNKV